MHRISLGSHGRRLALLLGLCAGTVGAQQRDSALSDLPLTEVPAATGHTLAVFWSGDGGWADLPSTVSRELARHGVAVIGINSRTWMRRNDRSPDDVARDTERLLRSYLAKWSRSRILLVGYSRGAGFLPFIVTRLPADLRERIDLVALLGVEPTASFEFHLMDLVRTTARATDIPLRPELDRVIGMPVMCLYGSREDDTLCPHLDPAKVHLVRREGDHHFDRNYPAIAADILAAVRHP